LAGRAVGFYYETLSDVISDFKADPGRGEGEGVYIYNAEASPLFLCSPGVAFVPILEAL